MSERIDHAAESALCINYARATESPAEAHLSMIHAQVHATLALVEQQRIANLIALFHHDPELKTGGAASEFAGEAWDLLAGQHIREALGL